MQAIAANCCLVTNLPEESACFVLPDAGQVRQLSCSQCQQHGEDYYLYDADRENDVRPYRTYVLSFERHPPRTPVDRVALRRGRLSGLAEHVIPAVITPPAVPETGDYPPVKLVVVLPGDEFVEGENHHRRSSRVHYPPLQLLSQVRSAHGVGEVGLDSKVQQHRHAAVDIAALIIELAHEPALAGHRGAQVRPVAWIW